MQRNRTFDLLKGIGIFLVVLGHATFVNEKLITYVFSFHMPLFFIVSGILMSMNNNKNISLLAFVKRKLATIAVPYLCFSILYTIIDFFSVYFKQISFQDLKINAFCTLSLAGSGPLWFLPTLFGAEMILFLITHFIKKKNIQIITGLSIALLGFIGCFFFEPFYTSHKESLLLMFFMNFVVVILRSMLCQIFLIPGFFICGFLTKLNNISFVLQLLIGIILMLLNVPLALMNVNPDLHNMNFGNPFLYIICAYLGTLGLYLICNSLSSVIDKCAVSRLIANVICYWGRNSLVIMVTHLNFYFLYAGNLIAIAINPYITRAKSYIFLFNILWVAMLLSCAVAFAINKFAPWILGKTKQSK